MEILLIFCILLIHCHVYSASHHHGHLDNDKPSEDEYVVVHTLSGNIRGKVIPAVSKPGKVVQFLGIPFAEKPIGNLRFSDPVPKEPWDGTLDTLHHASPCQQPLDSMFEGFSGADMWSPTLPLNEDCLYLDIWSPYPTPKNASVMVWIHGGGFYSGTSSLWMYNGEYFVGYTNVIMVSLNYRLGAFGFLASGDHRMKGNFGLKDQVLALKWVKNNIAHFGGNPNSVTIFGESAGATSVGYHLISPMSQNLFHKAIMQSGSHNADWAFSNADKAKSILKQVLSYVHCPDDENMMTCLKEVPAAKFNEYVDKWQNVDRFQLPLMPVIDGEFVKENPIYSTEKNNLKQMPILLNVVKNEGSFLLVYFQPKHFHKDNDSCISRNVFNEIIDKVYHDLSPNTLEFVKFLYTDWTDSTSPIKNRDALIELLGDREFDCPVHHLAEKIRTYNSDVYLSEFNYRTSIEVWPEWMGVIHGAELELLFGHPFNVSRGYSEKDRIVSERMMTYWSNFAKFGNPNGDPSQESSESVANVKWPALPLKHQHLEISDELKIGQHYKDDICQFWNEVVPALSHLSCSTH